MTKTLPVTKARKELTTLVDHVNKKLDEYIITVNGYPAVDKKRLAPASSYLTTH